MPWQSSGLDGWFPEVSGTNTVFFECTTPSACKQSEVSNEYCVDGYVGVLCSKCAEGQMKWVREVVNLFVCIRTYKNAIGIWSYVSHCAWVGP